MKHSEFEIGYFLNLLFTGLWFLTTLFVLTVIGALIYRRFKTTACFYLSWAVVWVILYLLPNVWICNQLEYLCPFYVMGIAARNVDLYNIRKAGLVVAVLLFALCLSAYSFDCSMYTMGSDCLTPQYLWKTGLRIVGGMSGIAVSLYVAKGLARIPSKTHLMASVGMLTLPIYALHQKFLLVNAFLKYKTDNLLFFAVVSVLIMAVTVLAYKILHRNKYIALFLFGENKKQL